MKPECSLPHSQNPASFFPILSQINPVHISSLHFLKIHLNIVLPSTPRSFKWPHSVRSPHQNPVFTSPFCHTCYMPNPPNFSWFDRRNNIWSIQIIKLFIMESSPLPSPLALLRPKCLSLRPFSNINSLRSSLIMRDKVSHPYKTRGKLTVATELQSRSERFGE